MSHPSDRFPNWRFPHWQPPFPADARERPYLIHGVSTCGIGAQLQARLSLKLFAHYWNLTYLHRPASRIAHEPAGFEGDWNRQWNEFFDLAGEEQTLKEKGRIPIEMLHPGSFQYTRWQPGVGYLLHHAHSFADCFPQLYESILPAMRRRYHRAPKPALDLYAKPGVHMALHLRRGDTIGADGSILEPDRYLTNQQVADRVELACRAVRDIGGNPVVHVFTDGDPAGFRLLTNKGYHVHDRTDPFATYHHLVMADVLFTSRSSFSYTAALYRGQGVTIYDPFWHSPLPDWIVLHAGFCAAQAAEAEAKFREQMLAQVQA